MAPAVEGAPSAEEALRRILAGSGLEGVVEGDTLMVRSISAASEQDITLPGVDVRSMIDSYRVPRTSTGMGIETPVMETPFSVQVVPREVMRDQQVVRIEEALNNVSSVSAAGSDASRGAAFSVRGFGTALNSAPVLRDGYRIYGFYQPIPEIANLRDRAGPAQGPCGDRSEP